MNTDFIEWLNQRDASFLESHKKIVLREGIFTTEKNKGPVTNTILTAENIKATLDFLNSRASNSNVKPLDKKEDTTAKLKNWVGWLVTKEDFEKMLNKGYTPEYQKMVDVAYQYVYGHGGGDLDAAAGYVPTFGFSPTLSNRDDAIRHFCTEFDVTFHTLQFGPNITNIPNFDGASAVGNIYGTSGSYYSWWTSNVQNYGYNVLCWDNPAQKERIMNDPEFRGKPPEERTAPAAPAAPITAPAPASGGFPSSNWNNTDPKPAAPAAPAAPAKESGKFWLSPEEWEAYKGYAGVRPGSTKVDADINYIIIAFKLMPDEIKSVHRQAIDGLILNRTVPTLTRLKSLVAYAKRNNLNQYVPDDIKSNY